MVEFTCDMVEIYPERLMSMNIKSEEAHRLAKELVAETGESVTKAVTVALRERLERIRKHQDRDDFVERIMAIAKEAAPLFPPGTKSSDHEDLYDEDGLPK